MKIVLIGKGKTGSKILDLLPAESILETYGSRDEIKLETLNQADSIIVFTPGHGFTPHIPLLLKTSTPIIIGATGFEWEESVIEELKSKNLKWIHALNFSLGMNIVRNLFNEINTSKSLLKNHQIGIHEIHHTKKIDAPSGTALKWKEWLENCPMEITHERIGDVIGTHELTIQNDQEKITIKHESLNRNLFAQGAIWACENIHYLEKLNPGVIKFEEFVDYVLEETKG